MADTKLTKTIGEVDTRFVRPVAPVERGTPSSDFVSGLVETGIFADKAIQASNLKNEMEGITNDATAAMAEADSIMQEQDQGSNEVGKFHNELTRLKRAIEAGGRFDEDAMLVKAQAKLKSAIDKRPGYADELRSVYANTFGLSSGMLEAAKATQKARVDKLDAYRKDYLARGLDIAKWGTPEGTAAYMQKSALDQEAAFAAQRKQLALDNDVLGALDSRKELATFASTSVNNVESFLSRDLLVPVAEGQAKAITSLSDAELAGMSPEHKRLAVEQIDRKIIELQLSSKQEFGMFKDLSPTEVEGTVGPAIALLETYKAVLDEGLSAKNAKASLEYAMAVAEKKLYSDPAFAFLVSIGKYDIPVSSGFELKADLIMTEILQGRTTNPFAGAKSSRYAEVYNEVKDSVGDGSEKGEIASSFMKGMLSSTSNTFDWMSDAERYETMKWAQSEDLVETALKAGVPQNQIDKLKSNVANYAFSIATTMSSEIAAKAEKEGGIAGLGNSMFGVPYSIGKPSDKLRFSVGPNGITVSPKDDSALAKQWHKKYRDVYLSRLNESFKALANLEGQSVEEVANLFMQSTELNALSEGLGLGGTGEQR